MAAGAPWPIAMNGRDAPPLTGVRAILEDLDRIARLPLARSVTAPGAAYTSPEFFAWEGTHVFGAEWMCVAHVSQIPEPGDFLNLDLAG